MVKTTIVPTTNDILFGRGKCAMKWHGNQVFHSIVRNNKGRYREGDFNLKRKIAEEIVDQLQLLNPPSRFLKLVHADWIEVDRHMALRKTRQALRENNTNFSIAVLEARNISEQQALSSNYTTGQGLAQAHENDPNLTMTQNKPETEVQADDGRQKLTEHTSINVEDKKNIDHPSSVLLSRVHEALPKLAHQDALSQLRNALPIKTDLLNDDRNVKRRIDHMTNHREISDKPKSEFPIVVTPHNTPLLTEAEPLVKTRAQALRKFNEKIQALKEAEGAVAESLQELRKLGLFMDKNGEIMNNPVMPEIVSPDTMLNQQQALPINYNMEQQLAIEALEKSRKYLNKVPEVNNNVNDRAMPELIKSNSAMKYDFNDTIPECPQSSICLSQDVSEDTIRSSILSVVGNSICMAPDIIKSEDIENHEHGLPPNEVVSLGIETKVVPRNENRSYLFNLFKHIGNNSTPLSQKIHPQFANL